MASAAARLEANSVLIPFCGCRIWMGALNESGYGVLGVGRTGVVRAHRLAYELRHGKPAKRPGYHGTVLRHRCDTPSCINPDHLDPGSQRDNIADAMARGRVSFGSRHFGAKLSEQDIADILAAKGKEKQIETARRYGVDRAVISNIYRGKAWTRAAHGGGL